LRVCESQKSQSYPIEFVPIAAAATRSIALETFRVHRTTRRLPVRSSFRLFADPQTVLKRNCVAQVVIGLSTLASTAVLLVQVVPAMLNGLQ
jgi:hypothetical protein